jgi:PAS domain S-box-containing protein
MKKDKKTKEQLLKDLEKMRQEVAELKAEEKSLKQTLKESKKANEQYRLVVEKTSDVISVHAFFDLKATYLYASPSVKMLIGYEPEELIGRSPFEFIHPEDKKKLLVLLKQYFSKFAGKFFTGKEPYITERIEYRFKDKWGNWRYFQSTGNIVGNKMFFITRDITEHKKAEEALYQSQQEFASLFKSNPEALVYIDDRGNMVDINSRFRELFGYSLKEIKGKKINEGIIHPSDKIKEGEELDKIALRKGYTNFESIRKKKDGTLFPVLISGSPVILNGKPRGVIGTFIDITDRKIAKDKLEKSYKKLQKTIDAAIDTMSRIIEAKDPYISGHQQRVSQLAAAIAKELHLPPDKIEGIRVASLIHDIGKIGLPTEILSKPSKLTDIELSLIKGHP